MITGNLNVIPDSRIRYIISKGPKYRFPSNVDFPKCHREIAASLNDFSIRWCKRKNVEPDASKEKKINIFKIIGTIMEISQTVTELWCVTEVLEKKQTKGHDLEVSKGAKIRNRYNQVPRQER